MAKWLFNGHVRFCLLQKIHWLQNPPQRAIVICRHTAISGCMKKLAFAEKMDLHCNSFRQIKRFDFCWLFYQFNSMQCGQYFQLRPNCFAAYPQRTLGEVTMSLYHLYVLRILWKREILTFVILWCCTWQCTWWSSCTWLIGNFSCCSEYHAFLCCNAIFRLKKFLNFIFPITHQFIFLFFFQFSLLSIKIECNLANCISKYFYMIKNWNWRQFLVYKAQEEKGSSAGQGAKEWKKPIAGNSMFH